MRLGSPALARRAATTVVMCVPVAHAFSSSGDALLIDVTTCEVLERRPCRCRRRHR